MTKASTPSGSLDEAIAFRQGISVVTIKDQLTGMLPKFSAGTRSRIVIDGNAPESDIYYDDSMIGLGPGSIVPTPPTTSPVFLYDHDFSKFNDLYDIPSPGINNLLVSGSYTGDLDATFRIQIANPDDPDVYTISVPVYQSVSGSPGLDDMHVVVDNITETTSEGEERIVIASGSYEASQGINVYKVEIASAEEDAVDTIRWYKNDTLLTPAGSEEVITAVGGNTLIDGTNKIVVKFDYDGFEDYRYGSPAKHTVGDSWLIVAGAQQFRWSKGEFDTSSSSTLETLPGALQDNAGPIGILQTDYQLVSDGISLRFPAQAGYPDGSDPNVPATLWEFSVTSLKPEAAITAMQESSGKIQIYPDHRTEQRDFGQPKFHSDFDTAVRDQAQISTVNVSRLPLIGEQSTIPGARTTLGNTQLYDSPIHKKKKLSALEANLVDERAGIPILDLDPLARGWKKSSVSSDGSVGPYFTIKDLRDKATRPRNNHFWFNHGNTTTSDITLYDDKDPAPQASDPIAIDISGRDLSEIEFKGSKELESVGIYSIYNIPALMPLSTPVAGNDYWSIDSGITMVSVDDVHPHGDPGPITWPSSVNTSGDTLYSLVSDTGENYVLAAAAGWSPDIGEDDPGIPDKMSVDKLGNIIVNTIGVPTPLEEAPWMEHHGYFPASFSEVEWLQRNGYVAYEDVLHNNWFTLYDHDYQAYCVQFNVVDNIDSLPFVAAGLTAADLQIDTDDDGVPDKNKTKADPLFVKLNIDRFDTAEVVSEKLVTRLQQTIPVALLNPLHPFYVGVDTSATFKAKQSTAAGSTAVIELMSFGKVQQSDVEASILQNGFQAWLTNVGSLGYAQSVLDSDQVTTHQVGNCICLYNATSYAYIAPLVAPFGHADLPFGATLSSSSMLWSNDSGETLYTLVDLLPVPGLDADASGAVTPAEAWSAGYVPYVGVDASSPHIIWFNLEGLSRPLAGPAGLAADGTSLYNLWSYSLDDDYYSEIDTAFAQGNILSVMARHRTPGRTASFFVNEGITLSTHFSIPFISTTTNDSSSIRILQRDPGPVVTAPVSIDDVSCHSVNSGALTKLLHPGMQLSPDTRDRDYVCDSILLAVNDPLHVKEKFIAEKRVVENYATFKINCVAEQKSGKLFDYTNQSWTDPDPDVLFTLAKNLKGGSVDLSNYEPNVAELFANIPQKEIDNQLIWKKTQASTAELTAASAGFDPLDPVNNNYDLKNRTLWSDNVVAADRAVITTSYELGLEDDDMSAAGWFNLDSPGWENITETQWMTHEGFHVVPAFTHKISRAAYFFLPHPDINFYVWFDVGQLSADPGDDGALDPDIAVDIDGIPNIEYNGGAVRVSLDSYSTSGDVAQQLVNRINSTRHDVKKSYVQIDVDDDANPIYQAIRAGNISEYFTASINPNDSSVVDVICKKPGLINSSVFDKNSSLNLPVTESGDTFFIDLVDDGDTDFYVDITNAVPGFLLPPVTDVSTPDADTNLKVTVDEVPYSPAQPGLTKITSEFLPYEDMNSMDRGYRKTLEDGTEVAVAGPVAYIEDDVGSLIYPVIMSNVSMKDPDQYDGVIEPLEIRSRASRNSPDGYFTAHDVKGQLQSDVASDSRRRSNPITQFVNKTTTSFEPYEDGIEHMESSPAADAFVRSPVFNGTGVNDIEIIGNYTVPPGTGAEKYYIQCVTGYPPVSSSPGDKFRWRRGTSDWSENVELTPVDLEASIVSLSFDDLTASTTTEYKTALVPVGSYGYKINVYARGDINFANEFYTLQYFDGSSWRELSLPGGAPLVGAGTSGVPTEINDMFHPAYSPAPVAGSGYTPGRYGYSIIPHWSYEIDLSSGVSEELPLISAGQIRFRVFTSPNVNNLSGVKNNVKISIEFARTAGSLGLDNGLGAIFGSINNHSPGDEWEFEAVSRSHQDSVGCLPLPGYLTWQESSIDPFIETTDMEEYASTVVGLPKDSTTASSTLAFAFPGFKATTMIDTTGSGVLNSTWEREYIRSLNGQAITIEDSSGAKVRLEFDDDGILENDGDHLISLLRPETSYIRFPDIDTSFQKRNAKGNLLWKDAALNEFTAYSSSPPGERASDYGLLVFDSVDFEDLSETEWASGYDLQPVLVATTDISPTLSNISAYAGKYFIITDELNSNLKEVSVTPNVLLETDLEGVNNTIAGGRYAVWFNVVDNETGLSLASAPEFIDGVNIQGAVNLYWDSISSSYLQVEALPGGFDPLLHDEIQWTLENPNPLPVGESVYYTTKVTKQPTWSSDAGGTIKCASPLTSVPAGTGWNPDPDSQRMSKDSTGTSLWTPDNNVTIDTAAGFGLDDTVLISDPQHPISNGYVLAELSESAWHLYEGYKNYSHMIPALIQVDCNTGDTINQLAKNATKAIKEYKNKNQALVFDCVYIHGPSYIDLHDLDPTIDSDEDGVSDVNEYIAAGEVWEPADYDNIKHVKIEPEWFNQYAYDPLSPGTKTALDAGWSRGHITIKVVSRNLGYHNITKRPGLFPLPGSHEPLYQNVQLAPTPPPTSVKDFEVTTYDTGRGGHHPLKDVLYSISETINDLSIDINSEVMYSDVTGKKYTKLNGDAKELYLTAATTWDGGMQFSITPGIVYDYLYAGDSLINNVLIRHRTKFMNVDTGPGYLPKNQGSNNYFYIDKLPGLKLTQGTPGPSGNTKVLFHHYKDDIRGNIVASDFAGGTTTGPHVDSVLMGMNPSTQQLLPHDHVSSAAGMIYNDAPMGTDSITFGGWKK